MKPFDVGMQEVTRLFESFAQKGTPDFVLDALGEWLEKTLPHYLKVERIPGRLPGHTMILMNTERLTPAITKRIKQMGFG